MADEKAIQLPCKRCQGRMLPNPDGDLTCFTCGFVAYAVLPIALEPNARLHLPSRGGQSLA